LNSFPSSDYTDAAPDGADWKPVGFTINASLKMRRLQRGKAKWIGLLFSLFGLLRFFAANPFQVPATIPTIALL
jgi:hypothetical protein